MIDAVSINGTAPAIGARTATHDAVRSSSDSRVNFNDTFFSTRIRVDNFLDLAIIEIRSSETGDVVRQFPTEKQIEAFKRSESTSKDSTYVANSGDSADNRVNPDTTTSQDGSSGKSATDTNSSTATVLTPTSSVSQSPTSPINSIVV